MTTMTLTTTELATIAAVASAVVPPVVSLLKREHWSAAVKQAVALVASAVASVVGIALTVSDWSATNVASLIGLSYLGSQVVYQVYFRGSATDTKLTSLPRKTRVVTPPPEPVPVTAPAPSAVG